jgi:hypothetical protein
MLNITASIIFGIQFIEITIFRVIKLKDYKNSMHKKLNYINTINTFIDINHNNE